MEILFLLNEKNLIVLVGKPNVGKSTLFNTLIGSREAIVGEEYGLTRDYQRLTCKIDGVTFLLVDTAGITQDKNLYSDKLSKFTQEQISSADIILFLVDSSKDLTKDDIYCSNVLRKTGKKILLLENKKELKSSKSFGSQGFELGHGHPIEITAKNKKSLEKLINEIKSHIKSSKDTSSKNERDIQNRIRITIAGRPNTGKSTLFNMINQQDRVITGKTAGTTRDSVITYILYKKNKICMADTAGIKKRGKLGTPIDKASTYYSRKEIRYSNIVLLIFDATMPFSNQDLSIASYIIKEGRSLLLIFNKWDLIINKSKVKKAILENIDRRLFDVKGVNCLFVSALDSSYKDNVLDAIIGTYKIWNKRISTSVLNNWLRKEFLENSINEYKGALKVKYLQQPKSRPPTFSVFCNNKKKINNTFRRSLENKLRKKFGFYGVPIRFNFLSSKNPYTK